MLAELGEAAGARARACVVYGAGEAKVSIASSATAVTDRGVDKEVMMIRVVGTAAARGRVVSRETMARERVVLEAVTATARNCRRGGCKL